MRPVRRSRLFGALRHHRGRHVGNATTEGLANSSADQVRHSAVGAILDCGLPDALPFAGKTGTEYGYYGVRPTILE